MSFAVAYCIGCQDHENRATCNPEGGELLRTIVRLILAAALGYLWWTVAIVIIVGHFLPRGWGLTWWGSYVLGATLLLAVGLCYWGLMVHERQLRAQGGPLRLPDWTVKWVVGGVILLVLICVIYAVNSV
jgi:thiamine transporter ThiT